MTLSSNRGPPDAICYREYALPRCSIGIYIYSLLTRDNMVAMYWTTISKRPTQSRRHRCRQYILYLAKYIFIKCDLLRTQPTRRTLYIYILIYKYKSGWIILHISTFMCVHLKLSVLNAAYNVHTSMRVRRCATSSAKNRPQQQTLTCSALWRKNKMALSCYRIN